MTKLPAHLRRHLSRYLLLLISATTALGLLLFAILGTEPGCLAAQGHWSSAAGQCHTRLCLLQGDCGQSAAPITGCAKVKRGDSRGRVYFHLGNPLPGAGNAAQWPDSKAGNGMILAHFEDDRLVSLACPVTP